MKKHLWHPLRNTGAYSGGPGQSYAAFRYGERNPRDVYIPGKPRQKIFMNKDQRQHVVEKAKDMLSGWELTPFEHEGEVRAGMRSELCLQSFRWDDADQAAADIVNAALNSMGAKRPSWEEGQRSYVEPRENCAWCQTELPEDMQNGTFNKRFCSEVCAKAAITHWDFESRRSSDAMMNAARDSIRRLRNPPKSCGHCQKSFRPRSDFADYCSDECRSAARRTVFDRSCTQCGTVFTPTREGNGRGQFCSPACHYAHGSTYRATIACQFCGGEFETTSKAAKFCSNACRQSSIKLAKGEQIRWLRPHVFDRFITAPVNSSRPAWLTPERFDMLTGA